MIDSPNNIKPATQGETGPSQEIKDTLPPTQKKQKPAAEVQTDGIVQSKPSSAPQSLPQETTAGLNPPNGARPQHQAPNTGAAGTDSAENQARDVLYGIEELASGYFDIELQPGETKEQAYTRTFALYTGIDLREIEPRIRAPLIKSLMLIGTHKPTTTDELLKNEQRIVGALEFIAKHLEAQHGADMSTFRQSYETRRANFSVNTQTSQIGDIFSPSELAALEELIAGLSAEDLQALASLFDQYHAHSASDYETILALEAKDEEGKEEQNEIQSDILVNFFANSGIGRNAGDEMLKRLQEAAKDHAEVLAEIHADTKEYRKRVHLAAKELQRLLKADKPVGTGGSGLGTP